MPRSQANLRLTFLQGLRGTTKDEKLLYTALLLERSLTPAGVGVYRLDWWAQEAELTYGEAEKALAGLEEKRYAFADPDTGEVLVRTLIRRDGIAEKPNMLWAACRAAPLVQSPKLRAVLAGELRKLPPKLPPKDLGNGKFYSYPDPHLTADQIDPGGPRDPGREPIENVSGTYPRTYPGTTGLGGPGTYPEPTENLPGNVSRNVSENVSGNVSGNVAKSNISGMVPGTTGGGGSGSTYVTSTEKDVPAAATDVTTDRAPARRGGGEHTTPAALNATAHRPAVAQILATWAATQPGLTTPKRRQLAKAVDKLLSEGADLALIPATLDHAHSPRFRYPVGALSEAYDDVRRGAHLPAQSRTTQAVASTAAAFDEWRARQPGPNLFVLPPAGHAEGA